MRKSFASLIVAIVVALGASTGVAQESQRPYREGPVVELSFLRVKPGMYDQYMHYLATTYKQIMDEQKKAGIILDWAVYNAEARNPSEPNLILTTTYANFAALDNLEERTDQVTRKVWATDAAANKATIERGAMREQLGTQTLRQVLLK